jgi:uncharacterized membrane protein (UPF0127 family)
MSIAVQITRRVACAAVALGLLFAGACSAAPVGSLPVRDVDIVTAKGLVRFKAEVAADPASQQQGLMYRKSMAADRGMIFVFPEPKPAGFWMHNTLIPLDLLFVDEDGEIESIAADAKPLDETIIPSKGEVKAVIEINGGLAKARGIAVGDKVRDPKLFPSN